MKDRIDAETERRLLSLLSDQMDGGLSEADQESLTTLLKTNPEARRLYRQHMELHARLHLDYAGGASPVAMPETAASVAAQQPIPSRSATIKVGWWLGIAASVVVGLFLGLRERKPPTIATLLSGENASWESSLPTAPGSALAAGYLKLNTGIATIQFKSGAKVVLEAPAHLVLETPMRGRLLAGSAVIDVPEPAIGFIMEAPGGYAVDHGTQFAVSVTSSGNSSDFEVLKGEISVHQPATGREVRLKDRQGASISDGALTTYDGANQEPAIAEPSPHLRIGTNGRAGYVNRRNKRGKHIRPEMLMVKQTEIHTWDMRAFFAFDVSKMDLESVKSVRLRLNQVPSGLGLAARLPLVNTFAVYGVTRADKEDWSTEPTWENAPNVADGVLLGTFDIPRSQQTGSFGINGDKLLEFLKADPDKQVTFVVVRETGLIDGEGKGLFHAFASDHHPEASGPLLEFTAK